MDAMEKRLRFLEERTQHLEQSVKLSKVVAFILCVGLVVSYSSQWQRPIAALAQSGTSFPAPFEIYTQVGNQKMVLMRVEALNARLGDPTSPWGGGLKLYANGQPSALMLPTGQTYKDPDDPNQNYLNLLATYLYKFPPSGPPKPLMVSSLALTRAGGSFMLWNNTDTPGVVPSHAVRITAKRGVGGTLIFSSAIGKEVSHLPGN
jgi:hypothetical protein